MTRDNEIVDVLVACDTVECSYRLVAMADERICFVWGNAPARVGDTLPLGARNTDSKGIEWHPNFASALQSFQDCAEALRDSGAGRAADEMMLACRDAADLTPEES